MRATFLLLVALTALGVSLGHAQVRVISYTVSIGSLSIPVGDQGTVDLRATDMTGPIGAWTVDIAYDPGIVSSVECAPQEDSICDPQRTDDTIRVIGASATGLSKDTTLATIIFQCESEGTSTLSVSVQFGGLFLDTFEVQTEDGAVSCGTHIQPGSPTAAPPPSLPPTGGGGTIRSTSHWPIYGLIGVGVACAAGFVATRLRARRS